MKDLYQKWVRLAERTRWEIGELIIPKQFLQMLNPELQTWVKEHGTFIAEEAAHLTDVFVAAQRRADPWSAGDRSSRRLSSASLQTRQVQTELRTLESLVESIKCFKCGQLRHKKPMSAQLTKTLTNVCYMPRETLTGPANLPVPKQVITTVELNGQKVTTLKDTGCTQTLEESELVPELYASGDDPVIVKYMGVAGQIYLMKVVLAQNLSYPVILGHDFPAIMDLLLLQDSCNVGNP